LGEENLGLRGGLRQRRVDYTGSKATATQFDVTSRGPRSVAKPTECRSLTPEPMNSCRVVRHYARDADPVVPNRRRDPKIEESDPSTNLSGAAKKFVGDNARTANRRVAVDANDWRSQAGRGRRNSGRNPAEQVGSPWM